MPNSPSYPSEHAAAAGAASTILAYLFPEEADLFAAKAEDAAQSRVLAGVNYPSDVEAGLALGRAVGEKMIEWAMSDGSDAEWTGEIPTGPGKWVGENPVTPLAGTWRTWVIASPDDYLSPPPPAHDSEQMQTDLTEIKTITRTFPITSRTMFWHSFDGAHPYWYRHIAMRLFEQRLEDNAPYAALLNVAAAVTYHDASVACFHTKYTYWQIRPPHLDAEVTPLFPGSQPPQLSGCPCLSVVCVSSRAERLLPGRRARCCWPPAKKRANHASGAASTIAAMSRPAMRWVRRWRRRCWHG